jgi:hypothetical protein
MYIPTVRCTYTSANVTKLLISVAENSGQHFISFEKFKKLVDRPISAK